MAKKTPAYKLQAIVNEGSWPYIGNGYLNQDGSVSLLLDRGVKLVLPDGTVIEASDAGLAKLHLRAPFRRGTPDTTDQKPAA